MTVTAVIAGAIGVGAGTAPAQNAKSANAALVPPTNNAASPFKADPGSSLTVGLAPDQTVNPLVAPQHPVVLSWNSVPGAVSYNVEISATPGLSKIVWSQATDQPHAAPNVILADGTYWWRVTAVDKAGTTGIPSAVATFAKQWDGTVTGGVLSDTPGGPAAVNPILVTPYLSWNAVPGAASYQVQIAPGNQFASPVFDSGLITQTGIAPGASTVLPDGNYIWRVRAFDAANNPGPWVVESTYTKAWTSPVTTAPADGATVSNFELQWNPVPGAVSYDVQVTRQEFNFTSGQLVVDGSTQSTAYVPDLSETQANGIAPGQYWWRVRPVINGVLGTWSPVDTFVFQAPTSSNPTTALSSDTTASTTALTPVLSWTPVMGAVVYRIDIATDVHFNHTVFSDFTTDTAWAMRSPLPDNAVSGYYWRVVWGNTANAAAPGFMVDETMVPVASFTKQTQPTVGTAASGVVPASPLFTWSDISGAGQYQLQVSRDQQFGDSTTQTMTAFGLGTWWNGAQNSPLTSGTWYWRVRPMDAAGNSLTYSSPPKSFVISPPAPTPAAPANGATVIASPELSWAPVNGACSYDVQVSDTTTFPAADSGGSGSSIPAGANTAQTAFVPTGTLVSHPGTWYWRVRAELCNTDTGAWSASQSFVSQLPPQFNLNYVPTRVTYATRINIVGQLVANGNAVANPRLILERRLYPSQTYTPVATVAADGSGRFGFGLTMTRSADWQLRWSGNLPFDEGVASFDVTVLPRVSFTLNRSRVVRRRTYAAAGFVYPIRPGWIQVQTSSGWSNLVRVPSRRRFSMSLRATLLPGTHHLRLYVPTDANHTMAAVGSRARSLFVYDVIVIRK